MAKKYIQEFKSKLATGGTVSTEELQDFFSRLEGDLKDKKYGLVWESQTEQVIEQLKTNKVYLEEDQDLKITQDPDNPKSNILIEGDNYEALKYLVEINQKVDVIYIDPPYNTGNKDFIYNDRFIDKEDGFRHSQWLSFMDARLRLARELLTDDGLIFISIDDNEQSQLKLLCDEVFGEQNFITNIQWRKTGQQQNNGKNFAVVTEYIMVYTKFIHDSNNSKKDLIKKDSLTERKGIKAYNKEDELGKYRLNPLQDKSLGKHEYSIINPVTGETVSSKNWRVSYESFLDLESKGLIYWTKKLPNKKKYLDLTQGVLPSNVIDGIYNESGNSEIKEILGVGKFSYPKPVNLIKKIICYSKSSNAVVLDFFAGSGTTGHAVLELNKEDGGNRQFILCTNNENNIAEEVTYERLKRVMNGYTTPKGKDVPGIPSNLAYYKTKQVSKYDIDFDEVVLQHIIPTIQFTEGVYQRIRHSEHILQLGENIFIFNQYMVEDDEIDTLVGLVKDGDILYIQEGQVDYIKSKLPEGVVYKYLEGILPTNR